jgi:uncharacterized protein YndB with AHSA1/START domain
MPENTVVHSTFVLERRLKAPAARVWAAFADPALMRRWYADNRPDPAEEFILECRVGGRDRLVYRLGPQTPFPGVPIANEGVYLDVVEGERFVLASAMSLGDRRISAILMTVELAGTEEGGTLLTLTHQGAFFPGADGPQMREQGWRTLLDRMEATLED